MSYTKPQLPSFRLQGIKGRHLPTIIDKKPKAYTYCRYLFATEKLKGGTTPLPPVLRRKKKCILMCGDPPLCNHHFDLFHQDNE
jgi:hypothetical protein